MYLKSGVVPIPSPEPVFLSVLTARNAGSGDKTGVVRVVLMKSLVLVSCMGTIQTISRAIRQNSQKS
jgi:hypothetical protein